VASFIAEPCVAVLDAYFAVALKFAILKALSGKNGERRMK